MDPQVFQRHPASKLPAQPDISEPRQEKEKRANREDPWRIAPRSRSGITSRRATRPSIYAMGLIDQLLVQGADSRLYQSLVQKRADRLGLGRHQSAARQHVRHQGTDLWMVWLIHDADKKADDIIQAIDEEITRLQTTPVTKPSSSSRS